jgi:hypothetical protein
MLFPKRFKTTKHILPGCRIRLTPREKASLTKNYTTWDTQIEGAIFCCVAQFNKNKYDEVGCIGYIPLKSNTENGALWDDYLYGFEAVKPKRTFRYIENGKSENLVEYYLIYQIEKELDMGLISEVIRLSGFSLDELYQHLDEEAREKYWFLSYLILDRLYPGDSPEEYLIREKFLRTKSENGRLRMLKKLFKKQNKGVRK